MALNKFRNPYILSNVLKLDSLKIIAQVVSLFLFVFLNGIVNNDIPKNPVIWLASNSMRLLHEIFRTSYLITLRSLRHDKMEASNLFYSGGTLRHFISEWRKLMKPWQQLGCCREVLPCDKTQVGTLFLKGEIGREGCRVF